MAPGIASKNILKEGDSRVNKVTIKREKYKQLILYKISIKNIGGIIC